jgi:hypothetical protein
MASPPCVQLMQIQLLYLSDFEGKLPAKKCEAQGETKTQKMVLRKLH